MLTNHSDEKAKQRYAGLLSTVRFGPGVIMIMSAIALVAVVFYISGHVFLAGIFGALDCLLFAVKSMEIIQLSRPEQRTLIDRRCMVVSRVQRGKGGVVQVYDPAGSLDSELWSAESEYDIPEGEEALVVDIRTIVLIVKPTRTARNGRS
jgi:membrane protein implicated in regulation of membrane protease activity